MTSSIINYVIENYLANILEIDSDKTNMSIFSGETVLENMKIKPQIFESLNLPYFELVAGFVGTLKINISMPRFWLFPVKVEISNVFFTIRQKSLNKINEKVEIEKMEAFKLAKLLRLEEISTKIEELQNESDPGMIKQLINNVQVLFLTITLINPYNNSYVYNFILILINLLQILLYYINYLILITLINKK